MPHVMVFEDQPLGNNNVMAEALRNSINAVIKQTQRALSPLQPCVDSARGCSLSTRKWAFTSP